MSTLHLNVRLLSRPSERHAINFDLKSTGKELRSEVEKKLELANFELIYCGRKLDNEKPLDQQSLKNGSIVQVLTAKPAAIAPKPHAAFNESDVQHVTWQMKTVSSANMNKASRPEFLKRILELHPEYKDNNRIVSFLRDPILLASLANPDTIRRLAEEPFGRDLLSLVPNVVNTLNNKTTVPPTPAVEPSDSDSSSSSGNSPSTSRGRSLRRITHDQLQAALAAAGTASSNSLANISARNLEGGEAPAVASGPASTAGAASSSSAARNRITQSMFLNALADVVRASRSERTSSSRAATGEEPEVAAETTPAAADPVAPPPAGDVQQPLYLAELQQMRELGLNDTETNLQALIMCNGDVEAAINLVFSGMQ